MYLRNQVNFDGGSQICRWTAYVPAMVGARVNSIGPPGARELSSGAGSLSCSDAAVLAAEHGEEEAVLEWLDGGGRADATYERDGVRGITLPMGAANQDQARVVELLIQRGAEINLQNSVGDTALTCAANNGHERVVELLIRRGADVNLRDSIGCTALTISSQHGHERVVELLLRHGADINLQNSGGDTALMRAAQFWPRAGGRVADSARR